MRNTALRSMVDADPDVSGPSGRVFEGRYAAEREIGRGATSIVWRARDQETGEIVAVKVLRAELCGSFESGRFLSEVARHRELRHPNIVPIITSGVDGELPFLVMPYFAGGTLRDRIRRETQLSLSDAVAITRDVALALDHAHCSNLLHRDVKPENILFDETGGAHLADFGIARALILASGDTETTAGLIRGTVPYMSPEQAGAERALTNRSDVYSLGCIVYEMLAGAAPFTGVTTQAVLARHKLEPPPRVRFVRQSVPRSVDQAIVRALAKVPSDRFATATDFADALRAGAGSRSSRIGPVDAWRALPKPVRVLLRSTVIAVAALIVSWQLLGERVAGTRSVSALRAYERGRTLAAEWRLEEAEAALQRSVLADADFALANLWLAQVRMWIRRPTTEWSSAAERAWTAFKGRSGMDASRAEALAAVASSDRGEACGKWETLTERADRDATVWFSLGACRVEDNIVVPDRSSPSGWRFRTSLNATLAAYEKAFLLDPATHRAFAGGLYFDAARVYATEVSHVQSGVSASPSAVEFSGYVHEEGDSVFYLPFPSAAIQTGQLAGQSDATLEAIRRQRARFHAITSMWRSAMPLSADAAAQLAVALDLRSDPGAVDTLEFARTLPASPRTHFRLAALTAWMLLKTGVPSRLPQLRAARLIADSLLAAARGRPGLPADEAQLLAGLAALTGRTAEAVRYARLAGESTRSPALAGSGSALIAYASMGGPSDSIISFARIVQRAIDADLPQAQRASARNTWLSRAAYLSIPATRIPGIDAAALGPSRTDQRLRAWYGADLPRARAVIDRLRTEREQRGIAQSVVSVDVLYAEAAILAALGDNTAAVEWLAPAIDSLAFLPPKELASVDRTGPLVRAMSLRARSCMAIGQREEAARWARAVLILWQGADSSLQPELAALREIVGTGSTP